MEEARRRREHDAVMHDLGVYDADWALYKDIERSDIQSEQNRLLLTKSKMHNGHLQKLFPEVDQLLDNGVNAQVDVDITIVNAEGVEKAAVLRYLNSNGAYRIKGPGWGQFVEENGLCRGDRLDIYTCKRGEGKRCLLLFKTEGGGGGGSPRARAPRDGASNGRKRCYQRAAVGDTVADGVGSGDADRGSGKPRRSRDNRGDHRRDANGAAADSLHWAKTNDTGRRRGIASEQGAVLSRKMTAEITPIRAAGVCGLRATPYCTLAPVTSAMAATLVAAATRTNAAKPRRQAKKNLCDGGWMPPRWKKMPLEDS